MADISRATQPFVVRAYTRAGFIWVLSVDESSSHGLIRRGFDVPAMETGDLILTDQDAMRRNLIMTEGQHLTTLLERYPGATLVMLTGNGNLKANFGFVAHHDGRIVALPGEPMYQKCYTAVTFWKDARTTIEDVWFVREHGEAGIACKQNGGVRDITAEIEFATTGQPLVRHRQKIPLDQIVEQFYDTRHLVGPIRIGINGSQAFVPNAQLQQGLLRKAVDGPVRVTLEAQIDKETVLPLNTTGWVKLAETNQAALEKTAGFLRQHELLKEGENLAEPAVLLRLATQTERMLAQALDSSGYRVVGHLGPLNEGEACFVNGHIEVYFRKAIYPHNIFVTWSDGSSGVVVYPGKSGREGTTLEGAQMHLTEDLGVQDAVLLDNGGDVRLKWRGCELVSSSENRAEIRSVLALLALPGARGPLGVSVH